MAGNPPAHTRPREDDIAERRVRVAELRKSGFSQRRIAAALSVSVGTVNSDLQALRAEWQESHREDTDAAMWMDIERLDELLLSVWVQAKQGNLQAVDRALRIIERRARMFGYDIQPDLSGAVDAMPITVVEVVRSYDDNGRFQKLIDATAS